MLTVTIYLYLIARKLFVQQMTISIIKKESMPKKHVHLFNFYLILIAPDTYRSSTNPFEEYDNLGRTGKPRKPNMEMHPIYHPFGRSGGGAPVKDDAGKVNTILHGHSDVSL